MPWPLSPTTPTRQPWSISTCTSLGDGAIGVADRQVLGPHGRALPRLDLGEVEPDLGFGAFDLDQLQAVELLGLVAGLAGRAGLGAVLGDEGFELAALGERGGVDAAIVLAALLDVGEVTRRRRRGTS